MAKKKKILVVATSQPTYGDTPVPTGAWLGEITHFYDAVAAAGYDIDIVSPKGGKIPIDPVSVKKKDPSNEAFLNNPELARKLEASLTPDQVNPDEYDAIYFSGGHGTMYDFRGNPTLTELTSQMYSNGKVVSAVCHGTAGLLDVKGEGGRPLIAEKLISGFANLEERIFLFGRTKRVPFLLQDAIKERGARYVSSFLPFRKYVVTDGRLVTGQNPFSARAVGEEVVKVLTQEAGARPAQAPSAVV